MNEVITYLLKEKIRSKNKDNELYLDTLIKTCEDFKKDSKDLLIIKNILNNEK